MPTTNTTTSAPKGSRPAKRAAATEPKAIVTPAQAKRVEAEVIAKELAELIAEPVVTKTPRTLAVTSGTCECRVCGRERPVTKFPTKAPLADGSVLRDDRCRECRDEQRDLNKAAAAAAAAKIAAAKQAAKAA